MLRIRFTILIGFFMLSTAHWVIGQDNYYFVGFKDKVGNGYSVSQPEAFLSEKSIERRNKQNIAILSQDLPITDSYKSSVINFGVEVFESSKWFNGIIIKCTSQEIEQIKAFGFVNETIYLAPQNYSGRKSKTEVLLGANAEVADSLFQNKILNIAEMHSQGYYGNNITIAVLDGGFLNTNSIDAFNHLYSNNQISYTYDFISKTSNVYKYISHGTKVLSFMAGQLEGEYQGIAPKADYMLFVTENAPTEYRIEEYYWLIGAEKADSAGVDIINTSLGYNTFDDPSMNYSPEDMDGSTTVVSKAAHIATEKGILVVVAAGNAGNRAWEIITAPADIRNGLAIGSINENYTRSSFSSFGPSADGRVKPDVVANGFAALLINEFGVVTKGSGTSYAAPQVAALIAGIWEAYPSFSALELVEAVRLSASNVTSPDNEIGYGVPGFIAINNYLEAQTANDPVLIYPNPVSYNESLKVKFVNPSKVNSAQLDLYESTGKKIAVELYDVSWGDNIATLELDKLTQGIYFLKVFYNTETKAFRIVKL